MCRPILYAEKGVEARTTVGSLPMPRSEYGSSVSVFDCSDGNIVV